MTEKGDFRLFTRLSTLFYSRPGIEPEDMRNVEQALKVQLDIPESAQLLNGGLWSAPIHKEAELTRSYPRPILSTRHRQISTPR